MKRQPGPKQEFISLFGLALPLWGQTAWNYKWTIFWSTRRTVPLSPRIAAVFRPAILLLSACSFASDLPLENKARHHAPVANPFSRPSIIVETLCFIDPAQMRHICDPFNAKRSPLSRPASYRQEMAPTAPTRHLCIGLSLAKMTGVPHDSTTLPAMHTPSSCSSHLLAANAFCRVWRQ